MTSRYYAAVESRRQALTTIERQPEKAISSIREVFGEPIEPAAMTWLLGTVQDNLAHADCYFWSDTITDLVATAARTLPGRAVFRKAMLPSLHGFAWLEHTLDIIGTARDYGDQVLYLRGFSWFSVIDESGASAPEGLAGYVITWVSPTRNGAGIGPVSAFALYDDRDLAYHTGEGYDGAEAYNPLGDRIERIEVRVFMAMLHFLEQQLLESRAAYLDRPSQHRIAREDAKAKRTTSAKDPIQVITLRRPHSATAYDEESDRQHVAWSCQWIVRGHWRQQWYRSEGRHHTIWIHPYPKGDPDMPMKTSEKIFAVVR